MFFRSLPLYLYSQVAVDGLAARPSTAACGPQAGGPAGLACASSGSQGGMRYEPLGFGGHGESNEASWMACLARCARVRGCAFYSCRAGWFPTEQSTNQHA